MTRLRWLTAGESHGPALTVIVDGVPAGLKLLAGHVRADLARRQRGYGRGGRMKIETDTAVLEGGVRGGETLGGPVAMRIENRDFANWTGRMGPAPFEVAPDPVSTPRPGHADLAGAMKFQRRDLRDILERASARETASRVAAGAVARQMLLGLGVRVASRVRSIGGVDDPTEMPPARWVLEGETRDALEGNDLRVLDEGAGARMRAEILAASHAGDSVGGVVEVVALGLPPGLGSHTQWDRRLDGRIAQAVMSVHAIKAVEIGDGWAVARGRGSAAHDGIAHDGSGYVRTGERAGGVEGGMTHGGPLVVRAAMKPLSTLRVPLPSVDVRTRGTSPAAVERTDICAVPAAGVVVEAMLCLTLADAALEKFGGDSMGELLRNLEGYRAQAAAF